MNKLYLGYACLNTLLRQEKKYCSRKITMERMKQFGIDEVKNRIRKNLDDLEYYIRWNEQHGIKLFRISSELFPHINNQNVHEKYTIDFAREKLFEIGKLSKIFGQRLTFHPGQFNQIGTPKEHVYQQTLRDLATHADVMDMMGLDENSIMIVHGGGLFEDKENTIKRIEKNIQALPEKIRNRLCLENDEFYYGVPDLLPICEKYNIPLVFDAFHHYIKNDIMINEGILERILNIWKKRGIKPKFHISEQRPSSKRGAHADFVEKIPEYLLELPEKYGIDAYLMIEAKMKEQALFALLEKYFVKNIDEYGKIQYTRKLTKAAMQMNTNSTAGQVI